MGGGRAETGTPAAVCLILSETPEARWRIFNDQSWQKQEKLQSESIINFCLLFFPFDTSKTAEVTGASWAAQSSRHREQEEEQKQDEEEEEEDLLTEPTEGPSLKPAAAQQGGVSSSRAGCREAGF